MSKPPNLSDVADLELMALAREGDEDARREIVRRQGPRVFDRIYRLVRNHETAEDLTQDTFVKMFRALESNGPERKPSAWVGQIAHNTALDYVRLKRPDSTRSPLTITPDRIDLRARPARLPGDTPSPDPDLLSYVAEFERAVRRLRPKYRRCFLLHYVEERSYDEIAEMLDLPLGTVKSRLSRAKRELKRMLQPAAGVATTAESSGSAICP
jgi:RNA polymerase sigma factor (sigma-70 family)